jgi:hypothetical protein
MKVWTKSKRRHGGERKPKWGSEVLTSLMGKILRFLVFCPASALTLYCGWLFLRSLSLGDFDDPGAAGFRLAGFVWGFRLLSAVGSVGSAIVAGQRRGLRGSVREQVEKVKTEIQTLEYLETDRTGVFG